MKINNLIRSFQNERDISLNLIANLIGRKHIWSKELTEIEKDNYDTDLKLYEKFI